LKTITEQVDVVIAGGGTAGHVAAIQAARAGVKTAVIEAGTMLGGTMTAGGVYMPNHFYSTREPVVLGIVKTEIFGKLLPWVGESNALPVPGKSSTAQGIVILSACWGCP
jgi:flavin-dependent dehydrogenase